MARDHQLKLQLLSDPKSEVIKAWGVHDPANATAWPSIFVVSRDGVIRYRNITDNYRKRPTVDEILNAVPEK